jgi:hypothetical protein
MKSASTLNLYGGERRHSHHQYITAGGTINRPKFTTKHLAALDFLLNIPMKNENKIKELGIKNEEIRLKSSGGMVLCISDIYIYN